MKRKYERWAALAARRSQLALWSTFVKWVILGGMVGLLAGSASALFLASLNAVTQVRLEHAWLLFLLPAGGALVSGMYMRYGKSSSKGNNLILEQIRQGNEAIPLRMAPLVLGGTLITHLFGGSAGREGTAVQMGGSLADALGRWLRIGPLDRRILLMCGISGGFGSIFGTPLAGTVFGLEVIAIGLISHKALLPCFAASFTGDLVASRLWGVHHIHYQVDVFPGMDALVLVKVIFASILFGLCSLLFSELTHYLKRTFTAIIRNPMLACRRRADHHRPGLHSRFQGLSGAGPSADQQLLRRRRIALRLSVEAYLHRLHPGGRLPGRRSDAAIRYWSFSGEHTGRSASSIWAFSGFAWLHRCLLRSNQYTACLLHYGHRAVRLRRSGLYVHCLRHQLSVLRAQRNLQLPAHRHLQKRLTAGS